MSGRRGEGARLLGNSALNVAAFGVSLLLAALLVPYVVGRIGIGDFGRAGIVIACFAPLQLVGTVLGQSVARDLAAPGAVENGVAGRALAAALFMCAAAVVTVLVLLSVAWLLVGAPDRPGSTPAGIVVLLIVFSMGWAFQQFSLVLQAVAIAAQNYRDVALVTLLAAMIGAASVVLAVHMIPSHAGYLLGLAFGYLASMGIWVCLLWVRYAGHIPIALFGREDVRRILRFGKWQSVTQLAGTIGNQMDRYGLGLLTNVTTVGRYNIAMRLQEVVYMVVLRAADVLFPYFASLDQTNTRRQLQVLATGSFALNTLAACAIGPLLVLAGPIVDLWVGPVGTAGTARMLVTLAAAGLAGSGVNVYVCWAMGTGNNAGLALMSVLGALATIVFSLVLIALWGERAAGFGALIGGLVMQSVAIRNLGRTFGILASTRTLMACGWPPLLGAIGVALLFRALLSPGQDSWMALLGWYATLSVAIACASVMLTSLSPPGRAAIGVSWSLARRIATRST